jgi:hypothetical protein
MCSLLRASGWSALQKIDAGLGVKGVIANLMSLAHISALAIKKLEVAVYQELAVGVAHD